MTGPEPTEFDLGCFFHGFEGDVTPEKRPYRTCVECGHIFWTEQQLLTEFNEDITALVKVFSVPEVPLAQTVDEIFFCCWCAHDF